MTPTIRRLLPLLVVLVVAVVGAVVVLTGGDDDTASSEPASFGPIEVSGSALPGFGQGGLDGAVGLPAPTVTGEAPDGTPVEVAYDDQTLLVFMAHWCPHCQAELPRLVALAEDGRLDGLDTVVVATGTDADAPNFPPVPWLEREGWTGTILLDDEASECAAAFGLTSFPYLVLVDGDGRVVARTAGELSEAELAEFVGLAPRA